MSEQTQSAIEKLIARRAPELAQLTISWFGGEPLLAKDIVLRIARYAWRVSQQFGFELRGGFTTNGYFLSRSLAEELYSLGHNFYQISLDGWGADHDSTRRLANGRGTFDRIWQNLLGLRAIEGNIEVCLLLHVSLSNVESHEALCREIAAAFGSDPRFRVDFQDIRNMGGAGGENTKPMTPDQLRRAVTQLTAILNSASQYRATAVSSKLDNVSESAGGRRTEDLTPGAAYICYAARPNSILIRSSGRLGKCTVALSSPANDIGEILSDGTLNIDNPTLRRWLHGWANLDVKALGCPLHQFPKDRIGDGGIDGPMAAKGISGNVIPVKLVSAVPEATTC